MKISDGHGEEVEILTDTQSKGHQGGFIPRRLQAQAIITVSPWNLVGYNPMFLGKALPKTFIVKSCGSLSLKASSVTF